MKFKHTHIHNVSGLLLGARSCRVSRDDRDEMSLFCPCYFFSEAGDGSDIILWKCNDSPAFHWVHRPRLLIGHVPLLLFSLALPSDAS